MSKLLDTYKNTKWFSIWMVLGIQLILILFAYNKIVFHPTDYLYIDDGDGLRNYFTYYTYLEEKNDENLLKINSLNYPFGEYIFYTDNTPAIALPMKLLTHYVTGNGPLSLAVINYSALLGLLIATFLLYRILQYLIVSPLLIGLFSIGLVWINPQIERVQSNINLSYSFLFLAVIYLLILLRKDIALPFRKNAKYFVLLVLTIVFASFCHFYYLMFLGFMVGGFCLFWALYHWRNKLLFTKIMGFGLSIPIVSGAIVYGLLRWTDGFYLLRKVTSNGYNYKEFNLYADALYTAYPFNHAPFFLKAKHFVNFDSYSYLGAFALYGLLIFGFIFLYKNAKRARWQRLFVASDQGRLAIILFFMGVIGLSIALGEYAMLFNKVLRFDNLLNPFYYLSRISERFTQFRTVARFNWLFFWGFNLLVVYLLGQYYQKRKSTFFAKAIIASLLLLLVVDTADRIHEETKSYVKNPFFDPALTEPFRALGEGIDYTRYQAILPIPYYHLGSENDDTVLDYQMPWANNTFKFSMHSQLPLMSSTLGRTAVVQAEALFSIFLDGPVSPIVLEKLTDQPILIFYSKNPKDYLKPWQKDGPSQKVWKNMKGKIAEWGAKEVSTNGDWVLYELDVKALKGE